MNKTPSTTLELFTDFPDVLTIHQLREALGIGRRGAYKLLESRAIAGFKIGNTYKIPKTALIAYVQKCCGQGADGK